MRLASRPYCRAFGGAARRSACHRSHLSVVAFKEHDVVKDWRIKQMVDTCHVYYANIWSRGDLAAADALLDPKFVHRDLCSVTSWGTNGAQGPATSAAAAAAAAPVGSTAAPVPSTGMVVGPRAFKAAVEAVRQQYPDLYVEVEEVAVSDTHRIFVSWTSHGTQLEGAAPLPHAATATTPAAAAPGPSARSIPMSFPSAAAAPPARSAVAASTSAAAAAAAAAASAHAAAPSYHNSLVRGVDIVTFNQDRSKILEVNAFRQISSDERREVERRLAPNLLEIRLARLHWEAPEGADSSSGSSGGSKKR